jgi:hemoglobin/transferrin/lactoferrin receptor protein
MRRKSSSRAALRGVRSASTALSVLALGAGGSVAAQESTNEVAQLPPVVVTGRAESGPTVTVEAARIELAQATDLKDVLQAVPGVAVGGGQPAAQKIYVRGLEDKLLNVSIDGATQAGYLSHHQGQFLVVPELLKEARVSAGAGAATEGPGALGGTIRLVHKGADDFLRPGQQWGAFVKSGYQSQGDGFQQAVAGYGRAAEGVGLLAAFTFFDVENYEDGNGDVVDHTAHTQMSGFFKGDARIGDVQSVSLTYEKARDEGVYRHRPNFAGYFNHPVAPNIPVENVTDRDTVTLNYEADPEGDLVALKGTAFFTRQSIDRTGQYEMGVESVGFDLRNTSVLGDHAATYGADFRHDNTSFTGGGSITGFARTLNYLTTPDEPLDVFGLYVQDEWRVAEPVVLSAGVRLDHYAFEDYQGQSFDDTGVGPNAMLTWRVVEPVSLHLRYAQAFRGVTAVDTITRAEGGTVNSPDMTGERAHNVDGGVRYDDGHWFAGTTLFRQEIDDVIGTVGGVRDNAGELTSWGYSVEAGARFGGFTARLGVDESFPELNGAALTDTDFGHGTAMGRAWRVRLDHAFTEWRVNVGLSVRYVEAFDDVPSGIPGKDSYVVADVFADWRPLRNHDLTLQVALNNLLDEYYVEQATSGYNAQLGRVAGLAEPGFGVRLGASYKF